MLTKCKAVGPKLGSTEVLEVKKKITFVISFLLGRHMSSRISSALRRKNLFKSRALK